MRHLPESDLFAAQLGDSERDAWLERASYAVTRLGSAKNPYVGNKKKILVDFADIMYQHGLHEVIDGGRILDVFSGSAYVSYLFKHLGAAVWSNDMLSSAFLNSVSLIDSENCVDRTRFDTLCKDQGRKFPHRIIKEGYVPRRFAEYEADWLDRFRCNIEHDFGGTVVDIIKHIEDTTPLESFGKKVVSSKELDKRNAYAQYLASVVLYVTSKTFVGGRLNCGQVLAELEHRIQHVRNRGNTISFNRIPMIGKASYSNGLQSVSTHANVFDLFDKYNPQVDIIYLDPPYGGEQSNYAKMYKFFEFWLGQEERPEGADCFTMSKSYEENFNNLLSILPTEPIWILSYNESSWANIDKIVGCISEFKKDVKVEQIFYRYNYRKVRDSGIEYVVMAS